MTDLLTECFSENLEATDVRLPRNLRKQYQTVIDAEAGFQKEVIHQHIIDERLESLLEDHRYANGLGVCEGISSEHDLIAMHYDNSAFQMRLGALSIDENNLEYKPVCYLSLDKKYTIYEVDACKSYSIGSIEANTSHTLNTILRTNSQLLRLSVAYDDSN